MGICFKSLNSMEFIIIFFTFKCLNLMILIKMNAYFPLIYYVIKLRNCEPAHCIKIIIFFLLHVIYYKIGHINSTDSEEKSDDIFIVN